MFDQNKTPRHWLSTISILLGTGVIWLVFAVYIYSNIEEKLQTPPPTPFIGRSNCLDGFSGCLVLDTDIPDTLFTTQGTPYPTHTPTSSLAPTQDPTTSAPIPQTDYPTKNPTSYPTLRPTSTQTSNPTSFPTSFPSFF